MPSLRDEMLVITNCTGHPSLTLRAGFVEVAEARSDWAPDPQHPLPKFSPPSRVPHGVTLIGRLFDEGTLAEAGLALEREFGVAGASAGILKAREGAGRSACLLHRESISHSTILSPRQLHCLQSGGSSPMQAQIRATTMPVLEVELDRESADSESGELWMTGSIQMTTHTQMGGGGWIFGALKRVAGGGSLFMPEYRATKAPGPSGSPPRCRGTLCRCK